MIILKQDTRLDKQKLEHLLNRYGHVEYTFNSQSIQDDIDKVNKWVEEAHTTLRMENLKKVRSYLSGLLKRSQKGRFGVDWLLTGNKITSIPIEIKKIKLFNIQATDYIVKEKEAIISLDYTDVINIIAMEIAHTDFEISSDFIENKLKDIGVISVYDSAELKSIVDPKSYDKAMVMRIGETSYESPSKKQIYTYFGNEIDCNGTYREVIDESCSMAVSIIVQNLLTRISTLGYNVKVYGVFEDSVYFILPDGRDSSIEEELSASIIVRAFGRKFEAKPKVQVY